MCVRSLGRQEESVGGVGAHFPSLPLREPVAVGKAWPAVVACLLAAACETAPPPAERAESRDRIVSAVVEFEVGELDGAPEYTFGAIGDIAVDQAGRVFLADGPYFQIRVMDADGRALFTFGRRGEGPGDLLQPRRLGFDREGRLWVYNTTETSARYDAFSVEGESVRHLFRLRPQESRSGRAGPIAFDREGRLIHPTTPGSTHVSADRMNPSPMVRLHLDSAGQVRDSGSIPSVPRDSLGFLPVEVPAPPRSKRLEARAHWSSPSRFPAPQHTESPTLRLMAHTRRR